VALWRIIWGLQLRALVSAMQRQRAGTGACEPAPSRYSVQTQSLIMRASDRGWRVGFDRRDAMTQMTQGR